MISSSCLKFSRGSTRALLQSARPLATSGLSRQACPPPKSHARAPLQAIFRERRAPYSTSKPYHPNGSGPSDFAFAFDIDGVLLRSSQNLPGAAQALQFLQRNAIPFILLTNGGGKHESERVADLSKKFGISLSIDNFVQSHSPFQQWVHGTAEHEALLDKTVLVTGGRADNVRKIAEM